MLSTRSPSPLRVGGGSYRTKPSVRTASIRYALLGEITLAVLPAMAAVKLGAPRVGAYWLFLAIACFLVANALIDGTVSNLALIVGVLPAATMLRNLFVYNSIIVLLTIGLAGVVFRSRAQMKLLRGAGFTWLVYLAVLYWLVSFAITGDYTANLRILELIFGAAALLALSRFPEYCATALFGIFISLVCIGAGLYGYGDRLGYAQVGDISIGNPITFGEPLALLLLLLIADRGKWFMLQRNTVLRLSLCLVVAVLLLLSTSRGSWLVAVGGLLVVLLLDRRSRLTMLVSTGVMAIALVVTLRSSRGQDLGEWIGRTFADNRSMSNRTDGRADQWMLIPRVMQDEAPWGFGPGTGPRVYARYSLLDPRVRLDPGHGMAWHSLYLQFLVEIGFLGLAGMLILLAALVRLDFRHWRLTGEVMPLVGTFSFMAIALTVSGMDAPSGLFLGFGLATVHVMPKRKSSRRTRIAARIEEESVSEVEALTP